MLERNPEYKPLLFTTTVRNPERLKIFLKILEPFDGEVLNNKLIDKIVYLFIKNKVYVTRYQEKNKELKSILINSLEYSNTQVLEIIKNSPQNHKETGFDKGWPSRFDTWYSFAKELGFVNYAINKKIEISETGKKLILSNNQENANLEQQAFLNAFVKYQRKNPYKKVLNSNKPLILFLQVAIELKKFYKDSFNGINRKELPLFICWKDDDFKSLSKLIIDIRKKYGFQPSSEFIYEQCKTILGYTKKDEKKFKIDTIIRELPDEFIRKMRLTGLLTLRGFGRFLDIDYLKINLVKYILKTYKDCNTYSSKEDYFNYMKIVDTNLIDETKIIVVSNKKRRELFLNWVNYFTMEELKQELLIVTNSKWKSKHEILKFINEPIRLEFLVALSLQKRYSNLLINPNYSIDDEGLPVNFAGGGKADIICESDELDSLIEVTLLTGTQQNIREMPSIARHLKECKKNSEKEVFSLFLAPSLHEDTIEYCKFIKFKDKIDVHPITIANYIKTLEKNGSIKDFK